MTKTAKSEPVDVLLAALLAARPPMDDEDRALAVAVYRRLARGHPVTEADLGTDTGHGLDRIHDTLASWPGVYRNDAQHVIGFWGLTVADMPPHRYRIRDVQLSTWCAWDTLFLTRILGATAHIESVDAHTAEPLTLTVASDGTVSSAPADMVLSFLDPTDRFDADIIASFCHYVHFFARREHGEHWTAQNPGTYSLSLDAAAAVGQRFADDLLAGTGEQQG